MTDAFNGIQSLDHPVLAVNSLDSARVVYERLGFTVPPRGSHVEWGTGNLCIMFPDDYLEMRGIIDASRFVMHLDQHLERFGEGLMGVAFRTDDVALSYQQLIGHGIETSEPRRLTRNFEHPDGWTKPSFELCAPAADAIEGLMHVVVLQHLTPELIRKPEYLEHPNAAVGVNSMSGRIDDVQAVAGRMTRLFGDEQVDIDDTGIHVKLATGQRMHLLTAEAYTARFGELPEDRHSVRLEAMELRVADLDRTESALGDTGVKVEHRPDGSLRVGPGETCGVVIDFTEGLPR